MSFYDNLSTSKPKVFCAALVVAVAVVDGVVVLEGGARGGLIMMLRLF